MEKAVNFADRLSDLIEEDGKSLRQIAKECKMSYSSLSKYQNNSQTPDANSLQSIADYFNVTTDYLLCRTDVRRPDATLQAINKQTGLSERAIMILQRSATQDLTGMELEDVVQRLPLDGCMILSKIIESPLFPEMIDEISSLLALSDQEADAIMLDDERQQLAELFKSKAKLALGIRGVKQIRGYKEIQASSLFRDIIKALEQEANSNGH